MNPPPDANSQAAPAHSRLFTVRVWSEQNEGGQAAWRFKVQHVLSGEARYFHDWQALVDFIISHYPRLL
jgi:subtilisin-like proprotein convertase family protein